MGKRKISILEPATTAVAEIACLLKVKACHKQLLIKKCYFRLGEKQKSLLEIFDLHDQRLFEGNDS